MMILLLSFLQKQSLAFAVYLFGICTLHTGPGLKKKAHVIMLERLMMLSPEILDPVLLTEWAQAGERQHFRRSCARSPEATPRSSLRLGEWSSSVDNQLSVSESVAEPVGLASRRGVPGAVTNETRLQPSTGGEAEAD